MSTSPYSLRLDPKLKARLEKQAELEDRSSAYIVQQALEKFLSEKDYERKIAEEAFAEAEKGIFISGEKVHAWMEAWGKGEKLPFPEPDIFPETKPQLRKAS